MGRANRLLGTAIALGIIIVLLLPSLFIPISFFGKTLFFWAGMLSLIVGIFSFIQLIILAKHPKWITILYQLLMVLLGIILLSSTVNAIAHHINKFANSIVTIIYILILLIVIVLYKKHINPGDVDVSQLLDNNKKKL